jgi:hypothetical protein
MTYKNGQEVQRYDYVIFQNPGCPDRQKLAGEVLAWDEVHGLQVSVHTVEMGATIYDVQPSDAFPASAAWDCMISTLINPHASN